MSVKTYSLKKDGSTKLSANFRVREFACNDGTTAGGLLHMLRLANVKF